MLNSWFKLSVTVERLAIESQWRLQQESCDNPALQRAQAQLGREFLSLEACLLVCQLKC